MKQLFLSLIAAACLLIFSNDVLAQSGFYVQPGVSYKLGATNDILGLSATRVINSDGNWDPTNGVSSNLYGSYGGGVGLGLEVGYFFNKNFGASLGLNYVLGKEVLVEEFRGINTNDFSVAKNRRLAVSPGVTVDAGLDKVSPYARFGLLIPVAGSTKGTRTSDNCVTLLGSEFLCSIVPEAQDFESFEATSVAKGQFSLGFTTAIGARYKISDMISIFGELSYDGLRIRRNTYEVTGATINKTTGVSEDVIPILSAGGAYQYTEYVDELDLAAEANIIAVAEEEAMATGNPSTYGTKANPAHETAIDANFSTFNIGLGVRFTFGAGYE